MLNDWSMDLVSQYKDYDTYQALGLGAAILKDGNLVSGASAYSRYRDGIEIEIDTKEEFRRKGLVVHQDDLPGSSFDFANMGSSVFHNINMGKVKSDDIDIPLMDLSGIKFQKCNLSNVEIKDCDITGLKINGIDISELLSRL